MTNAESGTAVPTRDALLFVLHSAFIILHWLLLHGSTSSGLLPSGQMKRRTAVALTASACVTHGELPGFFTIRPIVPTLASCCILGGGLPAALYFCASSTSFSASGVSPEMNPTTRFPPHSNTCAR